ncbi:hypothetical protein EDB81DRAFT_875857 [Dactylonectria macrodidyma]|uniref:Uncharacterized protein n=1 Tax=Dactylonectria macrodidyma TaxID=307937 RepID=A0A9P9FX02_9HYPO|nr:hypothetical protein EDB81DRAFT_875857 [Dactylonectria macrodidyma]
MKIAALLAFSAVAQAITIGVFENHKNGGGQFKALTAPTASSRSFIGDDAYWNDRISYIQIPPKVLCQFWDDLYCKGSSLVVPARDGGTDLNIPQNHNAKISSYACFS